MRAVHCRQGTIHVIDRPPPAGDGIRVKVSACGIGGSDLHMQGGFPTDRIPGHETADAIITHRLPLEAAREAFETARNREAGSIEVVLEP